MQIVIDTAAATDYEEIGHLIRNELGYQDIDFGKLKDRIMRMNENQDYATFVARHGNNVVGFIGLFRGIAFEADSDYLRISALAVRSGFQGCGVGTKLVRHAEEYAAGKDISLILVNSGLQRTEAHKFYEKNGYGKKGYSFKKFL